MSQNNFVFTNLFDIVSVTILLFLIGRSLFSSVLKELYVFVTLLVSFMAAWNFHETKVYIMEVLGITLQTGQLILFLFIFFVLLTLFGAFKTVLFNSKIKVGLLSLPLRIFLSFLSALLWINVIYTVVLLHVPSYANYIAVSQLRFFTDILHRNIQYIYQQYFTFF